MHKTGYMQNIHKQKHGERLITNIENMRVFFHKNSKDQGHNWKMWRERILKPSMALFIRQTMLIPKYNTPPPKKNRVNKCSLASSHDLMRLLTKNNPWIFTYATLSYRPKMGKLFL